MSFSVNPIGGWLVWTPAAFLVIYLTYLAYRDRIRANKAKSGSARLCFALRMLALTMTLFAGLRPSLVMTVKRERPAMLLFQVDKSRSMTLSDQAAGRSRWDIAVETLGKVDEEIRRIGPPLEATYQNFDSAVSDYAIDEQTKPDGSETALGTALADGPARLGSGRVAAIYLLSDGASNSGQPPMTVATNLRALRIPVNVVTFGSATPDEGLRDIAVKDLIAGPTVFVKNQLQVRATVTSQGFAGRKLTAQLFEEDSPQPVASVQFDAPENGKAFDIRNLSYIPEKPGETKLTLKISPLDGEITTANNEIGTYVNVLKGGLNVLYVQGPAFSWEYRFLARALDASPDIRVDLVVLRKPASLNDGDLDNSLLEPGKYDVFVIDAPVSVLTPTQIQKIATNVQRGAGLLMLGGRLSFSGGGWANTPIAGVLPVDIPLGMAQSEPKGGLKIVPTNAAAESYVTRVASDPAESDRIWRSLPPMEGAHVLGQVKPNAAILLETEDRKPLLVSQDLGRGRTLAFAGETWVWPRGSVIPGSTQDHALAHRRFWRQTILWLARKENQDENAINLVLDQRRIPRGGRLDFTAFARDAKGDPVPGVSFRTRIEPVKAGELPVDPGDSKPAESASVFVQGSEARGNYIARRDPGEYRLTVEGVVNGQSIGEASSRFLVSQEDRELEQPTADPALLAAIAATTGGKVLTPENLVKELTSIDLRQFSEFESQEEFRLWDNWPLFLMFLATVSLEWILRRKAGMV